MTEFEVETQCGTTKEFDSRSEAEEGARTHETLCEECDVGSSDISPVSEPTRPDGGQVQSGEVVDQEPGPNRDADELPSQADRSVETDPLDIVPGYMVDEVQGEPAINKRGYAVIANRYDIGVTSEPLTLASETDFEHAEFTATAVDDEGREYTGHGSAHADRGDDKEVMNEMAETRAMKRAVAWASGYGINAFEELTGILEDK